MVHCGPLDPLSDPDLTDDLPAERPSAWAGLRPGLAVVLSPPLTSPAQARARWLVQLRWAALAGMGATLITGHLLVPALRLVPLAAILAGTAASNLAWARLVARGGDRLASQILADVSLLTALLWFSGGLQNPFAIFLTFHIALAGALCDGRTVARVGLLALAAVAILAFAPSLPFASAPLGAAAIELAGRLAAIVSLGLFLGTFALVYARRVAELRDESARNERMAMIGRLVGGMSHELATPLGTILLAARDLGDMVRSDGEAAELATTIAAQAERASDVISLLRGHLRPDLRAEAVDLAVVVPALVTAELDRQGFAGARAIDASGPVEALVLRPALEHVIRNLVANAVHAAVDARPRPGGGRVAVSVVARGPLAEVSISDDGPGFSPRILARLGEPFLTTKDVGEGLGLGLYVSGELARRMGASLRAETAEGGGARVTLTVPRGIPVSMEAAE